MQNAGRSQSACSKTHGRHASRVTCSKYLSSAPSARGRKARFRNSAHQCLTRSATSTTSQVQRFQVATARQSQNDNNVLSVLDVRSKQVQCYLLDEMLCSIRLVRVPVTHAALHNSMRTSARLRPRRRLARAATSSLSSEPKLGAGMRDRPFRMGRCRSRTTADPSRGSIVRRTRRRKRGVFVSLG